MIDQNFLYKKYYIDNLNKKGFPERWISGACWINSQYHEAADKFKKLGKQFYTLLDLEKAIKYNNVFDKEVCKDKTLTIDDFLNKYIE